MGARSGGGATSMGVRLGPGRDPADRPDVFRFHGGSGPFPLLCRVTWACRKGHCLHEAGELLELGS